MPCCGASFRARIGLFHQVLIRILGKKAEKFKLPFCEYSPFTKWDSFTDFSFRCVVTTVCTVLYLLCCKGVLLTAENNWFAGPIYQWFGGNVGDTACLCAENWHLPGTMDNVFSIKDGYTDDGTMCRWFSDALNGKFYATSVTSSNNVAVPWLHDTAYSMGLSTDGYTNLGLFNFMLLALCGDIETNPGPTTDELIIGLQERMDQRMDMITQEFRSVSNTVNNMSGKLECIAQDLEDRKQEIRQMEEKTDRLEKRIEDLEEEIERQEIFSRRDNMIFYGIPEKTEGTETHMDCADTIVAILNKVSDRDKDWDVEDIARAHRLGKQSRDRTRPIIIKLQHSRDKQSIITDRNVRSRLKQDNIAISDDLTRQQKETVKKHRERGLLAYFRGSRLFTRPLPPRREGSRDRAVSSRQQDAPPADSSSRQEDTSPGHRTATPAREPAPSETSPALQQQEASHPRDRRDTVTSSKQRSDSDTRPREPGQCLQKQNTQGKGHASYSEALKSPVSARDPESVWGNPPCTPRHNTPAASPRSAREPRDNRPNHRAPTSPATGESGQSVGRETRSKTQSQAGRQSSLPESWRGKDKVTHK